MERVLSDYEKIKRAEEIYNRRRMNSVGGTRVSGAISQEKSAKKELNNVKKMVLQICICIVVYFIIYLVQNSNYIFSEEFMNKTREILSYDIDFKKYATQVVEEIKEGAKWIGISFGDDIKEEKNDIENEDKEENENVVMNQEEKLDGENIDENTENNTETNENNIENNIGETNIEEESNSENGEENVRSQMEMDADIVKENYELENPLYSGMVTSPYGEREISPKFHLGVDLGENTGTEIASAINGTATQVSTIGDYGKHIRITSHDGNLETLYAHCSELCIEEGQNINIGDIIAKVGSTGNATGPHLHFEMVYEERYINPELVFYWEAYD